MSIASKIQDLDDIRTDIRTELVAQGISAASTHNYIDFPTDIRNIGKDILPSEYEALEYIEIKDNHYILTDYYPYADHAIEAEFSFNALTQQGVYCSRASTSSTDQYTLFFVTSSNPSSFRFDFSTNRYNHNQALATNVRYKTLQNSNKIYLNGNRLYGMSYVNFTSSCPLMIGCSYVKNGSSYTKSNFANMKLYSLTSLKGNFEWAVKYKPCTRLSDSKQGVYDFITQTFYPLI